MPSGLIGGAMALGGGIMGLFGGGGDSNAATEAAQIQAQAAAHAADLQYKMYQEAVAREQPWVTGGGAALSQLGGIYGLPGYASVDPGSAVRATPIYQDILQRGVDARDLSAASKGLALSGAQQKGLQDWGSQSAMQYAWNPYITGLTNMSNWGQSGAALQGAQGIQTGALMGQDYMSGANALAQGVLGQYAMNQANQNNWLNIMGAGLGLGMSRAPGGGTNFGNLYNSIGNWFTPSYDIGGMSNAGAGTYGAFEPNMWGGWGAVG